MAPNPSKSKKQEDSSRQENSASTQSSAYGTSGLAYRHQSTEQPLASRQPNPPTTQPMLCPTYTPNGLPYHQTAGQTYPTTISPYAYAPHTAPPPGGSTQRQASSIQYMSYAASPPGGLIYRPQSTGATAPPTQTQASPYQTTSRAAPVSNVVTHTPRSTEPASPPRTAGTSTRQPIQPARTVETLSRQPMQPAMKAETSARQPMQRAASNPGDITSSSKLSKQIGSSSQTRIPTQQPLPTGTSRPSNVAPSTRSTGSATFSRPAQVLPGQPVWQATAGKDEEQEGYIVVKRVPEDNDPRTVGHPASGDPIPCLVTDLPSEFKTMFNMVIHLPGDQCKTRVAKLDTGSSVDVLSQSVVDALGMELESYYGPPIAPLGTALHRPIGQLRLEWHVMGKKKTYITNFLVLDRDSTRGFDALLSETTIRDVGFYTVNHDVWHIIKP